MLVLCITAKSKLIGISKFYCDFLINYNFLICTNPSGALSPLPPLPLTHARAHNNSSSNNCKQFQFPIFPLLSTSPITTMEREQHQKQNQKENFKVLDIAQTINLFPYTHPWHMIHMWNGIVQKGGKSRTGVQRNIQETLLKCNGFKLSTVA